MPYALRRGCRGYSLFCCLLFAVCSPPSPLFLKVQPFRIDAAAFVAASTVVDAVEVARIAARDAALAEAIAAARLAAERPCKFSRIEALLFFPAACWLLQPAAS